MFLQLSSAKIQKQSPIPCDPPPLRLGDLNKQKTPLKDNKIIKKKYI